MKRKLLCALAVVMLLCIAHSWALASDDVTLSWSQAAATCEISDAYYCTAGGAQAFIAGGLTRIPVGADVYVTLTPLDGQSALSSAYVVFDGAMMPLEPGSNGTFHFVMQECKSGQATIVAECGAMHAITYADGFTEAGDDGLWQGEDGALRVQSAAGGALSQASSGDSVLICVLPDDEYALQKDSLRAVTASNVEIMPERNESGDYCFTMPDEPVTISAEFVTAAMVSLPDGVECVVSGEYAYQNPPRALPGSEVELTISPSQPNTRIRFGSQGIQPADTGITQYVNEQDGVTGAFTVSLTMPEGGAAVLADVGALCRIESDSSIRVYYAADRAREISACCEGDEMYAVVDVPSGYGLVDDKLTVTSSGNEISVLQRNRGGDSSAVDISLTAPACNIELSANLRPLHSITSVQAHGLGIMRTYPAGSAAEGSTVTIALTPVEGWQVRDGSLEICAPGTRTVVAEAQDGAFIMPECDCEISVEFEPVPSQVNLIESACFTLNADYALSVAGAQGMQVTDGAPAGAIVNVYAKSVSGCTPEGIYLKDGESGETRKLSDDCQAEFVMPAHCVTVYALCSDGSHVSPLASASDDVQTADEPAFPYEAQINTEDRGLRLRKDSSADADVVGAYASGTRVTVERLSDDGQWAYVTVHEDSERGWMKAEYIERVSDDTTAPAAQTASPSESEDISITITLPEIRVHRPYIVEKTVTRDEGYVFKHIMLL